MTSKTIFLPKRSINPRLWGVNRTELDAKLSKIGCFDGLYDWQRSQIDRPKFRVRDGPPYANGRAHVGHAANKLLKDFVVKSRVAMGYSVDFRPGWDCHGLPIEMQVLKDQDGRFRADVFDSPLELRAAAREVAERSQLAQAESFKRWAVTADWANPYRTMDRDYVAREMRAWAKLLERGLLRRENRPVWWSCGARTALADAELEYNDNHKSRAALFRFQLIDLASSRLMLGENIKQARIYALVWTTTPWTLPLNDGIAVGPEIDYVLVRKAADRRVAVPSIYLVAAARQKFVSELLHSELEVVGRLKGKELAGLHYEHCMAAHVALRVVEGNHVTEETGTGCVHVACAHGAVDFTLAESLGHRTVESLVDDQGRYRRALGTALEGKEVLGDGQSAALELLKRDVLAVHDHVHAYPYCWRTKQPVIQRASPQWFLDQAACVEQALRLVDRVQVWADGCKHEGLQSTLASLMHGRAAWCVSRQRNWGTPIPYFVTEDATGGTDETLATPQLARKVADFVETNGPDAWWTAKPRELLEGENVDLSLPWKRGSDVLDVWFDSALAWAVPDSKATEETREPRMLPADVVVEGLDQFRGWFSSQLIVAAALGEEKAPFNRVLVHGFCVDDAGHKMSKSVGNVVEPDVVTDGGVAAWPGVGADGLRLWAALSAGEHTAPSKIGPAKIAEIQQRIQRLRHVLGFVAGALEGVEEAPPKHVFILDQCLLDETTNLCEQTLVAWEALDFSAAAQKLIHFVDGALSNRYLGRVRHRLYCGNREARQSAQFTLARVLRQLIDVAAPIFPHFATELAQEHPWLKPELLLRTPFDPKAHLADIRLEGSLKRLVAHIDANRVSINQLLGTKVHRSEQLLRIHVPAEEWTTLVENGGGDEGIALAQLAELYGIARVERLDQDAPIHLSKSRLEHCPRCRRLTRQESEEEICGECREAVAEGGVNPPEEKSL